MQGPSAQLGNSAIEKTVQPVLGVSQAQPTTKPGEPATPVVPIPKPGQTASTGGDSAVLSTGTTSIQPDEDERAPAGPVTPDRAIAPTLPPIKAPHTPTRPGTPGPSSSQYYNKSARRGTTTPQVRSPWTVNPRKRTRDEGQEDVSDDDEGSSTDEDAEREGNHLLRSPKKAKKNPTTQVQDGGAAAAEVEAAEA